MTVKHEACMKKEGNLGRRCDDVERQAESALQRASNWTIRFVRFLYIILCPHSRHRIGSPARIELFPLQSAQE